MKADPDFHPIASAWLDGTAAPPEQRLLDELLAAGPDAVEDFAALCRTEALLQQTGRSAAERRRALAAILAGKPWPQRAAAIWKNRALRWAAAAAAVLAIAAWALWPSAAPEENQTSRKNRVSLRMADSPTARDAASRPAREAPLPPAADGLEQKLRRCYVANFKTTAPLPEAAATLAKAITLGPDYALTTDVREPGDAPVYLQLPTSLPAWTLLQMMALQTGTDFQLSGHSLVFHTARKPAPREGSLARTSELTMIRTLYTVKEKDDHSDELSRYGGLTQTALGSRIEFLLASETSSKYTGTPRDVRVLELALNSSANPPVMVSLYMKLVQLPPGMESEPDAQGASRFGGIFTGGIFTDPQLQLLMRSLAGTKGVDLMTLPLQLARPGQEMKFQTSPGKRGLVAMLTAFPGEDGTCILHCDMGWGVGLPGESTRDAAPAANTQVQFWSGQTLGLTGFKDRDGPEVLAYITATLVQPDGTPLPLTDKAPAAPADNNTPPPDPPQPTPQEELPYGIPVVGEKGKVYSPYAPEKGFIDVEGLNRGTRVACPYTGKHFRVP